MATQLTFAFVPSARWPSASRRIRFPTLCPFSSSTGDSYLHMWNRAVDRDRKSRELLRLTENPGPTRREEDEAHGSLDEKTDAFYKILQVPKEERDMAQRQQLIDRAAAAIAAARAILNEAPPRKLPANIGSDSDGFGIPPDRDGGGRTAKPRGLQSRNSFSSERGTGTPGPDFWSWSPPSDCNSAPRDDSSSKLAKQLNPFPNPSNTLLEKEPVLEFLQIPFESSLFEQGHNPLPPFQSAIEAEKLGSKIATSDYSTATDEKQLDVSFSRHAAEAAEALGKSNDGFLHGINPDGSNWWRETGTEQRPDGVICRWTLNRGVSADGSVEWEDKYWEASDRFDYKELGSEKSGRDAAGNVWREYWRESMWQDLRSGLMHIEKAADKWGKNSNGAEWQEKWWEHYDVTGQAEKWAHKWCCIDPTTPLEVGHAHIWHERWGEKYDGKGSSMRYTDKWAERSESDGWSKWGDKWDEHFGSNGKGVKQGETWWKGEHGEHWNRTWGEKHNGSGWVHKYGKSSSGEHWDTRVQEDTWYERHPHFGFQHCYENSVQLRAVRPPPQES